MTTETSLRIAKEQLALVQERIDILLAEHAKDAKPDSIRDAARACVEIATVLSLAGRPLYAERFGSQSNAYLLDGF